MSLENVLRATTDFGAIPDAVWGLMHDNQGVDSSGKPLKGAAAKAYIKESIHLGRCVVECVKARDFEPRQWSFRIQLRNFIDDRGEIAMLDEDRPEPKSPTVIAASLSELLTKNPAMTKKDLAAALGVSRNRIEQRAVDSGWLWGKDAWKRAEGGAA